MQGLKKAMWVKIVPDVNHFPFCNDVGFHTFFRRLACSKYRYECHWAECFCLNSRQGSFTYRSCSTTVSCPPSFPHSGRRRLVTSCTHYPRHPSGPHATLQWRPNGHDGVSNHQPHDCLLNRLFKSQIKENIKDPPHWSLCGKFTGHRWIPYTKSQ